MPNELTEQLIDELKEENTRLKQRLMQCEKEINRMMQVNYKHKEENARLASKLASLERL